MRRLLGVTRLASIVVDHDARVTHWNRVAEELFGLSAADAYGHRLSDLLTLPPEHREAMMPRPGRIAYAWTGAGRVARVYGDSPREVIWWVYPLTGVGNLGMLIVGADAERLRREGLGVAIDQVLLFPPDQEQEREAARMVHIEPALHTVADEDAMRLGRRLAEILPRMGPRMSARIVRQVLAHGSPGVSLTLSARLPLAPYWGPLPRVIRVRPGGRHDGTEDTLETAVARDRLTFLHEASSRIGSTLDIQQTGSELTDALVPRFADFAAVQLLDAIVTEAELPNPTHDGVATLNRVAVSHDDEPGRWDDTVPVGEVTRLAADMPLVRVLTTGRPVSLPRISAGLAVTLSEGIDAHDLRPLIEDRSMLIVPLIARGAVLGAVILLRKADRPPFDDLDLATAEELARRAALSVDNARLYQREARTAAALQRSLLPDSPPRIAGVELCYRYLPASRAAQIGGDWFDAIPLSGGRIALVVGDVMGHGLTSAGVMGQLRTAVRTLALQDLPPDQVLRQLDDLAHRLGEGHVATCLYAVYDPVGRTCRMASAGHLPPVIVHADGRSELVDIRPGAPIGVGGVPFQLVEVDAPDGTDMLLFTDGLVEKRGGDIDEGIAALRSRISGARRSVETLCDLAVGGPISREDDVALVAARFHGIPKEYVATWTFEPEPRMVRRARRVVREMLSHWGLASLSDTVELLVSELVTNAVRYGNGDITLRLLRTSTLLCEVHDADYRLPVLSPADVNAEGGRGLYLVSRLSERWGTNWTATGKVVWFEHPVHN